MIGALLLAAGSGTRMGGVVEDKLIHPIGTSNAFTLSCGAFLQSNKVKWLVIVYKDEPQLIRLKESLEHLFHRLNNPEPIHVDWEKGGQERQDSVWLGLQKFPQKITHILVHDCARPFIRPETISLAADAIIQDRAVAVARPLKDTLRQRSENTEHPINPTATRTLDRNNLWLMETPQGAPKDWLIQGLQKARDQGILITDEIAAVELLKHPTGMIEPDYPNPKITTPEDFAYAEFLSRYE